jgi:hypothetical protein
MSALKMEGVVNLNATASTKRLAGTHVHHENPVIL